LPRYVGLTRIAEDVEGLVAVVLDLADGPLRGALVEVKNADASAERGEGFGAGAPNASGAAGYDRRLACQANTLSRLGVPVMRVPSPPV
jgi:hypothetical protein